MIPQAHADVYIDGIVTVRLCRSDGRPGGDENGYAMWSYNARPLGWVSDGVYLIECVVAEQLVSGELEPRWEEIPRGARLIHPRYTSSVVRSPNGWVPKIVDEVRGRAHSFKPRMTKYDAANLLDDLLRRRVGRAKPVFDPRQWLDPRKRYTPNLEFQLALGLMGPDIAALVRHGCPSPTHWTGERQSSAVELANLIDSIYRAWLDPVPLIGTILATHIKSAFIDLYRGSERIPMDADGSGLTFTTVERAAFRDRFRRAPMTDREYLDFVNKNFIVPLRCLCRRGKRWPNGPVAGKKSYQAGLHPRRDKGDFPIGWPLPAASRIYPADMLADPHV